MQFALLRSSKAKILSASVCVSLRLINKIIGRGQLIRYKGSVIKNDPAFFGLLLAEDCFDGADAKANEHQVEQDVENHVLNQRTL